MSSPSFLFLFRLAWTLKKSVQEILDLPQWERDAWRYVFDLFGPLDWKREDLLFARVNQYQAIGGEPLKNFILFRDPSEQEPEQDEEDLLKALGYREGANNAQDES